MDLGIKGKRVLVTGASQGLGKIIAISFQTWKTADSTNCLVIPQIVP